MSSPYINTKLSTSIILHPYQMDNNIYINLKKNLERKLVGKCYKQYGYVEKVIEIMNYDNIKNEGIIEAENVESSALYDLQFSCRLCRPLPQTQIICEISRVNKLLLTAVNGPILIIITYDRINNNVFFKDNNENIRYKKGNKSYILAPHDFVKINIQTVILQDKEEKIKAMGFMFDIATEEEKKTYYEDLYNNETNKLIDYEKYINLNTIDKNEEKTPDD